MHIDIATKGKCYQEPLSMESFGSIFITYIALHIVFLYEQTTSNHMQLITLQLFNTVHTLAAA